MTNIIRDKLAVTRDTTYGYQGTPTTATKVFTVNKGKILWIKLNWKPDNESLVIDINSRDISLTDRQGTKPEVILLGISTHGGAIEFKGYNFEPFCNQEIWIDICTES